MNSCGNSKLHQQSQVTESIGRGEETTDINKLLAYLFIRIHMVPTFFKINIHIMLGLEKNITM